MKTAVEWLHENNKIITQMMLDNKVSQGIIEQLLNCFLINLKQAKEMEKQQIIDAHYQGYRNFIDTTEISEQYYNETYGSKGSDELSKVAENTSFDTSSQTEISDEEIEEMLFHHSNEYAYGFKDAIKWYREQLKKNL